VPPSGHVFQLLPTFGSMAIESITSAVIERWLHSLTQASSTRTKSLVLMHGIFQRASYYNGHLTTPKSGKVRAVPLAPDVAAALAQLGRRENWTGDDDLVFAGETGSYLDGSGLRRRFKTALTVAGLRPLRFHDLRHTFGTRMIAKPPFVGCRSGWAIPTSRPRGATCTTRRARSGACQAR